jgi:hypothetical protein
MARRKGAKRADEIDIPQLPEVSEEEIAAASSMEDDQLLNEVAHSVVNHTFSPEPDEQDYESYDSDLEYDAYEAGLLDPGVGTYSSPPMWKDASRSPRTVQLRVCHVEEGIEYHVGTIHAQASVSELVRKFKKAGVYKLTPVDVTGGATGSSFPIPIGPDHQELLKLRHDEDTNGSNGVAVPGFAPAGLDPQVLAFFSQQVQNARAQAQEQAELVEKEREQLRDEWNRVSKERMSLAVTNTGAAMDLHAKLIDKDQERATGAQAQLMSFMQAQQQLSESRNDGVLQQQQQQFNLIQQQMKAALDAERLRLDAEKSRMQEARDRDRTDQERRDTERGAAWEREQERSREHNRMMLALIEKQHEASDPFGSVEKLIEKGAPLVALAKDFLPGLLGGGAAAGGMAETIATTIGDVVKGQIEVAKISAQAQAEAIKAAGDAANAPGEYEMIEELSPEQFAELQARQGNAPPETDPVGNPWGEKDFTQAEAPPGSPFAASQPTSSPPQRTFHLPQQPDAVRALDPSVAKTARKAIRELVREIRQTPQEEWAPMIVGAMEDLPQIGAYVHAATVKAALLEAGADLGLADAVIANLDASGLLSSEFPRG